MKDVQRGLSLDPNYAHQMCLESKRIEARRQRLGQSTPHPDVWGLALSGGGIRSATFCLGVLQALSRLYPKNSPHHAPPLTPERDSILARFDYLSTVSGGGYVGGFFMSLFVPRRLRAPVPGRLLTPEQKAAKLAYSTLQHDTPDRLRESLRRVFPNDRGRLALAWLRDNGRYLAPTGGGDALYAAASGVRSWIGLHYVLGTLLLCAAFLLGLLKLSVLYAVDLRHFGFLPEVRSFINDFPPNTTHAGIIWSVLWLLPVITFFAWFLPCSACLWLTYPGRDSSVDSPATLSPLFGAIVLVCTVILILAPAHWPSSALMTMAYPALLVGTCFMILIYLWLFATGVRWKQHWRPRPQPNPAYNVGWTLFVSGFALVIMAGAALHDYLTGGHIDALSSIPWLFCVLLLVAALRLSRGMGSGVDDPMLAGALLFGSVILLFEVVVNRYWSQYSTFANVFLGLLALFAGFARKNGFLIIISTANHRVAMTRALTRALGILGLSFFIAITDTFAQTLVFHLNDIKTWTVHLGLIGGLTWTIREGMSWWGGRKNSAFVLPVNTIAVIAGFLLALLLCAFWLSVAQLFELQGNHLGFANLEQRFLLDLLYLGAAVILALFAGMDLRFLNLSTYSAFYSARLTRAYLGATNGRRFRQATKVQQRSSAEPMTSDQITIQQYSCNDLAPLHLINVCLNQNVDPAEQLIQRDRKGRPMTIIANDGVNNGEVVHPPIAVDGELIVPEAGKQSDSLTLGEWLATSGAAISTGLGRQTSLGISFVLGLANVRLGRWWRSGVKATSDSNYLTRVARLVSPTHVFMLEELFGRFYGLRRKIHYLTDGGHFDNTGIYELLRPERDVKRILACDCGADPCYLFNDLANLIRLARIDFGLDLRIDDQVADGACSLATVFGLPNNFGNGLTNCRTALLLNGFRPGTPVNGVPDVRILVLKPCMFEGVPTDLENFKLQRTAFPQESTADQFFDEAQWESYRKLGFELGRRAFLGTENDPIYRTQFWQTW